MLVELARRGVVRRPESSENGAATHRLRRIDDDPSPLRVKSPRCRPIS